jgi:regulator of protease activity HflC (stomatin/prohibitin superfamily)
MRRGVWIAIVVLTGCTRISPGYVGIKVNLNGTNRGVQDYPIQTGRVWYSPFNEEVFEWPTFVQTASWTHDVNEGHPVNEEITFTTADQMSVAADISVGYSLMAEKVPHFYVKFRTADMNAFTHGFMRNLAREKFDNAAGKYHIEQIMGDNAPFLSEVRLALQNALAQFGVQIEQLGFIGAPRPPPDVVKSINLKVQATQLALQKENEIKQVQMDSQKEVVRAEAYAKALEIKGAAEAAYNRRMADSINERVVEKWRLDKWDGHLPYVNGGSTNPFVSLGNQQK